MDRIKLCSYEKIYTVKGFQEEFQKVLKETNPNGQYHKWLRRKLDVLDDRSYGALSDRDFEPLSGTDPKLYAIRYPRSPKNPRVVYVYIDDGMVCLLHTFMETSKKSGSDYQSAINIAQNRLKQFKQAEE